MVNIDAMSNTNFSRLTDKEEKFCQFYALEGSPSAAFRYAYSTDKSTPSTVASNAQHVLNRPHVAMRIYELQTAVQETFEISAKKKKLWLQKIIDVSLQTVKQDENSPDVFVNDPKPAHAAIAELNKMDGHLAASKKEISGVIGITIDEDDDEL